METIQASQSIYDEVPNEIVANNFFPLNIVLLVIYDVNQADPYIGATKYDLRKMLLLMTNVNKNDFRVGSE